MLFEKSSNHNALHKKTAETAITAKMPACASARTDPFLFPEVDGGARCVPLILAALDAELGTCEGCGFIAPLSADRRLCGRCEFERQSNQEPSR